MLFKKTAIFFLTLAAAILLLHNVVPHSHYHSEHSAVSHLSHGHYHNSSVPGEANHHHDLTVPGEGSPDDEKDFADILSIISHPSEGIAFLTCTKVSLAISKQLSNASFLISETFYLNEFILPPLLYYSPAEFFEDITFYPCTNSLRGPPSIAV